MPHRVARNWPTSKILEASWRDPCRVLPPGRNQHTTGDRIRRKNANLTINTAGRHEDRSRRNEIRDRSAPPRGRGRRHCSQQRGWRIKGGIAFKGHGGALRRAKLDLVAHVLRDAEVLPFAADCLQLFVLGAWRHEAGISSASTVRLGLVKTAFTWERSRPAGGWADSITIRLAHLRAARQCTKIPTKGNIKGGLFPRIKFLKYS